MFTRLTLLLLFLALPTVVRSADTTLQSATIQVNPVGSDSDHEWISLFWSQPPLDFEAASWRITLNGKTQKLITDERWSLPCQQGASQRWIIVDNFDLIGAMASDQSSTESLCWLRTNLALSNQLDTPNHLVLSRLSPERIDWTVEWQNADWSELGYPLFWTADSWRYLPFLEEIDQGESQAQSLGQNDQIELAELLIDPPGADAEQEEIKIRSLALEPIQLAHYYLQIEDKLERLPHLLLESGQTVNIKLQRLTLPNRNFEVALLRPTLEARQTSIDLWQKQKRTVFFEPKYAGWYRLMDNRYQSIAIASPPASKVEVSIAPTSLPVSPTFQPSVSKNSTLPKADLDQSLAPQGRVETIRPSTKASELSPTPSSSLKTKPQKPKAKPKASQSSLKPQPALSKPSPTVLIKSSRQSLPDNQRERQLKLLFLILMLVYLVGLALFRVWYSYQKRLKL